MVLRRRRKATADAGVAFDTRGIAPRFRPLVDDAARSQQRYRATLAAMRPGPLHDRMTTIGARIDASVAAIVSTVLHAQRIEEAVAHLDPHRIAQELKAARRHHAATGDDDPALTALAARFESTQRMLNALDDIDRSLRALDARLGAAVARATEIHLLGAVDDEVGALGAQLDDVLFELAALQSGLAAVT